MNTDKLIAMSVRRYQMKVLASRVDALIHYGHADEPLTFFGHRASLSAVSNLDNLILGHVALRMDQSLWSPAYGVWRRTLNL